MFFKNSMKLHTCIKVIENYKSITKLTSWKRKMQDNPNIVTNVDQRGQLRKFY